MEAADRALGGRAGDGEVDYQLGLCELYRGRRAAALAAWERVPPGTPFATRAAARTAPADHRPGPVHPGRGDPPDRPPPRDRPREEGAAPGLWSILYQLEGRIDDVRRAIVESWRIRTLPRPCSSSSTGSTPPDLPSEMTRNVLEKAAATDDRVWLGRANLAIRTGRFDEAARWLDACSERRPDDPVVWRARLELAERPAIRTGPGRPSIICRPTGCRRPSAPAAGVARARLENVPAERAALSAVIEQEPGDTAALDRLAELAAEAGGIAEVTGSGRQTAEIGAAKERYRALLRGDSTGDPAELARLAETLGRRIEARGWALIRDGKASRRGRRGRASSPEGVRADPGPGPNPRRALRRPPAREESPNSVDGDARRHAQFVDDAESPRAALRPRQRPGPA